MAFIKAKKTAWNTERGMALLYEDDPKNGVIIPIDALPPLGAHARRVIAGVARADDEVGARPTKGPQSTLAIAPIGSTEDESRPSSASTGARGEVRDCRFVSRRRSEAHEV